MSRTGASKLHSPHATLASADADAVAFLGVVQSARGRAWRERLDLTGVNRALTIAQRHGLPEVLARVLAGRGVEADGVETFLAPTLRALMPDPSTLRDMDRAAARLADAVQRGEAVAAFGDYDVDGACSSALLARWLALHGQACRIYIPDRIFEGYGPNPEAIAALIEEGARLIVTVDCGTTSHGPLAIAKERGVDVVVIDHHQADPELPEVHALVNPNRQDDLSGLGQLCAAGVTFMTLVATQRELRRRGRYTNGAAEPNLIALLDLVALATVCDVVPLAGLNRAFVTKGLEVMGRRENIGLRQLADAAGLNQPPSTYTLGFVLGPRINAGGRIGDAALGARLLSTDAEMEAARIAVLLDKLNKERKSIETKILEEAVAAADRMIEADPALALIVVGSERWHKGVVGLVASRLVERFGRPACVISWMGADERPSEQGTGSLRSIAGIDIGTAVRAAASRGILVKGGGHAMAAGLTVARDRFDEARRFFESALARSAAVARSDASLEIDGALSASGATGELVDLLTKAGPYGQGNPQPRFVLPAHRVKFAKVMGEAHVRCALEAADGSRIDAIAFRAVGQPIGDLLLGAGGMPIHVAGSLKRDTWGGRNRIEMTIEDAADPRKQV